ncbi:MAG: glycosidase [Candidatus Dormibacteria bacterium]
MSGFQMRRLWPVMTPERGNPQEAEGVLNPGAVRGPDGNLYLFPRLVARGNYSRIGLARVLFNGDGDPFGVERLGVALEPQAEYEKRPDGGGGCEDPRVTFVEPLGKYAMTYTAFSAAGPRIALAVSDDLRRWERLGLARFGPYQGIELDGVDDKDATLFPVFIPDPSGRPGLAMLHRPLFAGAARGEMPAPQPSGGGTDLVRESIWISYSRMPQESDGSRRLGRFTSHHRLAAPLAAWERLKIGVGTPPIMTRHGWLVIYHGVSELAVPARAPSRSYSAGVMVLSSVHPRVIRYRSPDPVLTPELPEERLGTVGNVVFPTGIDRRDDLGPPDRFDVYYGMADNRIGVARLDLPELLPEVGRPHRASGPGQVTRPGS